MFTIKKIVLSVIAIATLGFYVYGQELSPYIKVGESTESIKTVSNKVKTILNENGFTVLGAYNPSDKSSLGIIAFTRNDLRSTVVKIKDRGALAAVLKIGLEAIGSKIIISYTNPEYLLRAYLMDNYRTFKNTFSVVSKDLRNALSGLGNEFMPFRGTIDAEKLKNYHYKIMMPYFTDPVVLAEYDSFEQGLAKIQNNLQDKKGNTKLVYKLIYKKEQVAVFGIGLQSSDEGESHFLPKIGEAHVAALPYEIILQGKEATMLHGKYRIALYWPELTMGTFMKIMSTPGDIEDAMEAVCQ